MTRSAIAGAGGRFSALGAVTGVTLSAILLWLTRPQPWAPPLLADGSWQRPSSGLAAWHFYGWPALWVGAVLVVVLASTLPWWWPKSALMLSRSTRLRWQRWEVILIAAIVLLGCAIRAPLMTAELHRDEQDNLVHQIHGMFRLPPQKRAPGPPPRPGTTLPDRVQEATIAAAKQPGKAVWVPCSWSETWFESPAGNNTPLNSVLSRLCNTAWQGVTGSPAQHFSLVALRLPAFLAITVATCLFFAVLRHWFGGSGAAALGCLCFTLHPLIIRFGAMSRGYALMLLFLIATLYAWTRALEGPLRTGWCLMAAMALGGAVWCFPGLAVTSLWISGGLLVAVLASARGAWRTVLKQWVGAHLAAFAFWLPMIVPMAVQTAFVMAYNFPLNSDHLAWLPRYLGAGLIGTILPTREQLPFTTGTLRDGIWAEVWRSAPFAASALFALLPVLLVVAMVLLRQRRHPAFLVVGALLAGAGTTALMATWGRHKQLLFWYSCYLTPVVGMSAAALWSYTGRPISRATVAALLLLLITAGFPDGRTGRLPSFPPIVFERLATLYRGYWVVSAREGINVSVPAR